MRDRDPKLPVKMTGGVKNPLGAMALYLGSSLYRIHGTNDAKSIGRAASSGCFRMLNGHIVDLSARVDVGTPVTVVHSLPPELETDRRRASRAVTSRSRQRSRGVAASSGQARAARAGDAGILAARRAGR